MRWQNPVYLWLQIVPALLLIAWVVAERLRRRRLRAFGDPEILGVSMRWAKPSIAPTLRALGLAAAAAVLPLPIRPGHEEVPEDSLVEILLDSGLSDAGRSEVGYSLDDVEDQVRSIAQLSPHSYSALFRSGDPSEMVSPPSSDVHGLLILMSRLRLEWQPNSSVSLGQSVADLVQRKVSKKFRSRRLVVITATPAKELPPPRISRPDSEPKVLFVGLASGGDPMSALQETSWIRSDQVDRLRHFLATEDILDADSRRWFEDWSYTQLLAAFGFVALLAESFLTTWLKVRKEEFFG